MRDFAEVYHGGVITKKVASETLERLEIDELGLDATDRRLLSTMIKNYNGGPVGLETIAAAIGEESVTIEDVYEPYLMQIGFLSRTPRGRCVTPRRIFTYGWNKVLIEHLIQRVFLPEDGDTISDNTNFYTYFYGGIVRG